MRCTAAIRDGGAVPAVTAVLDGTVRVGLDDDEARPHPRAGPQDGRARHPGGDRPALGVRRLDRVGLGRDRRRGRHLGVRHRRHRWRPSRFGSHRRHLRRPRRVRPPPRRHGVCRGEGLSRPRPVARVPRDGRGAGARLAARLVPGVLHPLVGSAGAAPGGVGRRGRPRPRIARRGRRRACCSPCRSRRATNSIPTSWAQCSIRRLHDCDAAGITGAAITPFVLGRIAEATDGRSIPANLALAENNARVAAEVAVAIAR